MEQSVPKRRHIKFRRRGITQKKAYNIQGADKSLARPGKKQATATEDFEFHISYLLS